MTRVLVAGMGNVLRYDDGFGVEVARRLLDQVDLSEAVKVIEVGIGGIHLVQELMAGYDALIVIDAVERGSLPGTVYTLEVEVPDLADWPDDERADFLADTHYTTPTKALILAKALDVLPPKVYFLGCQPSAYDDVGIGLSEAVAGAVEPAAAQVLGLVQRLGSE